MKKKILNLTSLLFVIYCLIPLNLLSQENSDFKPSGNVILRTFFDYHTDFHDHRGFDITRAYIGYNYKFTPTLQARAIIDGASGKNSSNQLVPFLKNAYVNWNYKNWDVNAGLINSLINPTQEKYFGLRYVIENIATLNKIGQSADLGINATYKFNKIVSVDASITNGEGYKDIEMDNTMRYALGTNIKPVKNLLIRGYVDYYNKPSDTVNLNSKKDLMTMNVFVGYDNSKLAVGAEYIQQFNNKFIKENDFQGYSVFSTIKIAPKWKPFIRYDYMKSTSINDKPWNKTDGSLAILGIEYQPTKLLKFAANFRNYNYIKKDAEQFIYLNAEFNL